MTNFNTRPTRDVLIPAVVIIQALVAIVVFVAIVMIAKGY